MALREAVIVAGLGFRAGCAAQQLERALREALAAQGRELAELTCVCAPDFKRADANLAALAAQLATPLSFYPLAALRACPVPTLTQSSEALRRYGVGSMSEACALLGALARGKAARLVAPRLIAGSVTCALAVSEAAP